MRARGGVFHHQRADLGLRHGRAEALFACVDHQRLAAGEFQDRGRDEPVVDHHVGLVQELAGAQRQKLRVAWARTDKIDARPCGGSVTGAGQAACPARERSPHHHIFQALAGRS